MFSSCRWLCHLEAVPVRCPPRLGARGIGHVVGSCIMAAPAYASGTSGLDFQQFVDDVGRNRDFFISVASAAFAFGQLVAAFKASSEGKIRAAVAKAMKPFEPSRRGHPKASDGNYPETH